MQDRLAIGFISVFGMPPVDYVELAAELGIPNISIGLQQTERDPHGYPRYALREDRALRREIKAALAANEVAISLGENLIVTPEPEQHERWRGDLGVLADLGVTRVNSVSLEPDFARNVERYGQLTEVAAAFGVEVVLEFVPIFGVSDLASARRIVEQVDRPNLRLLIDTMHVGRSGATPADLRALPADLVGYVQLCDAPFRNDDLDYLYEAQFERRIPGDGELPLAEYLAALPRGRVIELEIPLLTEAERGLGPRERLGRAAAAARDLLATLPSDRTP